MHAHSPHLASLTVGSIACGHQRGLRHPLRIATLTPTLAAILMKMLELVVMLVIVMVVLTGTMFRRSTARQERGKATISVAGALHNLCILRPRQYPCPHLRLSVRCARHAGQLYGALSSWACVPSVRPESNRACLEPARSWAAYRVAYRLRPSSAGSSGLAVVACRV